MVLDGMKLQSKILRIWIIHVYYACRDCVCTCGLTFEPLRFSFPE